MKKLYTTSVEVTEGRGGHAKSSDGKLDIDLSLVEELGGPGGNSTNPEQLFAAGYAACYQQAIRAVADQNGTDIGESTVTANVDLGKLDDRKGFGLEVELQVNLPNIDREQAEKLIDEAHQLCPYSNAIRGNVNVNTTLTQ